MEQIPDYRKRTEWAIFNVAEGSAPKDPMIPGERARLLAESNLPPRLKKCTGDEEYLTATYWG